MHNTIATLYYNLTQYELGIFFVRVYTYSGMVCQCGLWQGGVAYAWCIEVQPAYDGQPVL